MENNQQQKMNIQWFPGHMTKASRMIEENISQVDAVCEILDARIPRSSHNPEIDNAAAGKPRLIVLNRSDLADPNYTDIWINYFKKLGFAAIKTDCKSGKGTNAFIPAVNYLLEDKIKSYENKGQTGRSLRLMVVGVPNVGKSSFINRVAGRKAAAAADKPGVTRGKQWIHINEKLDLLDTPGILWPKFENQDIGELLAVTNAIKSDVIDVETLAANFMLKLKTNYSQTILNRYGFEPTEEMSGFDMLELAAKRRGFVVSKGEYDIERMAYTLLKEFQDGKLGKLTLEYPE